MGEHEGGDGRVADHPAVRSPVGEAGHRLGVGQHLPDGVMAPACVVEDREHQHGQAVVFEHQVVTRLERRDSPGLGDGGHRSLGKRLVVRIRTQGIEAVQHDLHHGGHAIEEQGGVRRKVSFAQDGRSHLRLAQLDDPLLQRQVRQGDVGGPLGERVVGLPADEHPERAGGHLRVALGAVLAGVERFGEQRLPQVRLGLHLEEGKGHRTADGGRQFAHPRHLRRCPNQVLPVSAGGCELEDTGPCVGQGVPQGVELVLRGKCAGHRLAVHGPVAEDPGGGNPECSRFNRLAHDGPHLGDVVGGGRLVAGSPIAHDVAAHRSVGDLSPHVNGQVALLENVEVLGEGLPTPGHAFGQGGAGDVLHPFHELDEPLLLPGADRSKPDTAVAHDHGGHPVSATTGSTRRPRSPGRRNGCGSRRTLA